MTAENKIKRVLIISQEINVKAHMKPFSRSLFCSLRSMQGPSFWKKGCLAGRTSPTELPGACSYCLHSPWASLYTEIEWDYEFCLNWFAQMFQSCKQLFEIVSKTGQTSWLKVKLFNSVRKITTYNSEPLWEFWWIRHICRELADVHPGRSARTQRRTWSSLGDIYATWSQTQHRIPAVLYRHH